MYSSVGVDKILQGKLFNSMKRIFPMCWGREFSGQASRSLTREIGGCSIRPRPDRPLHDINPEAYSTSECCVSVLTIHCATTELSPRILLSQSGPLLVHYAD